MSEKPKTWNDMIAERGRELNEISPSMCLAKWTQTTLHLQTGQTHSCHHPRTHKIPLAEIEADPSALHNTSYKKNQRAKMLQGERPEECKYCWTIEDLPEEQLSDRVYKSAFSWSWPYKDDVLKAGATENFNPTYVEVSFDSTCNFKCAYCGPDISSKWMEEMKQHGAYPTSSNFGSIKSLEDKDKMPIANREENPYVDAFWRWWPDLYPSLHTFRITGGEPLLSKHTWRVFDYVIENPRPDLTLCINSNMDVPENLQQRLLEYTPKLCESVKKFIVYTSAESMGEQCEYIRYGMNFERFRNNVETFLELNNRHGAEINFMTTINLLSVPRFVEFLYWTQELKRKYPHETQIVMCNIMSNPGFLNLNILTSDIKRRFVNELKEFLFNERDALTDIEKSQIDRVCAYVQGNKLQSGKLETMRADFARYITEYDKRRKTDFDKTFPELEDFRTICDIVLGGVEDD